MHDSGHEHHRPEDRSQQHDEDREDDEEHERDEEEGVAPHGRAEVVLLGRRAAHEHGVTAGRPQLLAQRIDEREPLLAEGVLGERDGEQRAGRAGLRPADGDDLGCRPGSRDHRLEPARIGHDHGRRCARAGGERALEQPLPLDGLDVAAERVRRREARIEAQRPQRDRQQRESRHDPDAAMPPFDPRAEPSPEAAAPGRAVLGALLTFEARDERPERSPPADQEKRGQDREHRRRRDRHAHRADRAETRDRVHRRQREAEERCDDGAGRREDPWARPADRDPHRLVLVLVPVELLAVASREQERVVRPRAEHEHEQDAARLSVDDDSRVDEERSEPAHEGLCEEDGEERKDPEDGAAVDEHEEDEDERRGGEQQGRVDALEGLARVGRVSRRARDLRLEPVPGRGGDGLADGLDRLDQDLLLTLGDDLRHHERGVPVL